jgi:ribosomal protein S18 acetylase RimI-like enzyme
MPDVPDPEGFSHERWTALYQGFEHNGLRMDVIRSDQSGPNFGEMKGVVRDLNLRQEMDKMKYRLGVGEFFYNWTRHSDGSIEVEHDFVRVDPEYRDRGFASALERHLEEGYVRMGVDRITLIAAKIGAYAWAKQGYEFAREKRFWVADLKKYAHRDPDRGPAARVRELWGEAELERLERFIEDEATSEWEIAMFGREHAREVGGVMTWPGKAYLINNGWIAVKPLS